MTASAAKSNMPLGVSLDGGHLIRVSSEGPPGLVVETVSDASIHKDTERLPLAYDRAGVREFWLVDARGSELLFQIHVRGSAGYQPVERDAEGYQRSAVLECAYRLDRGRNRHGRLTFDLLCRD